MVTALDIITNAFQDAGIIDQVESPNNKEAQTGLNRLNRLIGSWANSGNTQYERVTESFSLSSGTSSYTIGSGATFDTVRPTKIVEAHVRQGNTDYELITVTDKQYQSIANKDTGSLPEYLNYTNEYPNGTINIYPQPGGGLTLYLTSEKPLTTYATTATTVDLPPGWEDALTYNLAVRLASVYGQPVSAELQGLARESKAMISLGALRNNPLRSQVGTSRSTDNIYSGYGS